MKEFAEWINNKFKCELPKDYFEFINKDDFSEYKNRTYNFMENGKKTSSDMHCFYDYTGPDNLKENYSLFFKNGIIKKNYLPIGEDSFGNVICLYLGKRANGSVYFVVHDTLEHECIKINNCFGDFLRQLQGEKELYVKNLKKRKENKSSKDGFVNYDNETDTLDTESYKNKLQEYRLKIDDNFLSYIEEYAGAFIGTYISFNSKGTQWTVYIDSIMSYQESVKQYISNENNKRIKNNYLPFVHFLNKNIQCLIKCGGRNVGEIYFYDRIMNELSPAFKNINDFKNSLMYSIILLSSKDNMLEEIYNQWENQADNIFKGKYHIEVIINQKKLIFGALCNNEVRNLDEINSKIDFEMVYAYGIYFFEKDTVKYFVENSFLADEMCLDNNGEVMPLKCLMD